MAGYISDDTRKVTTHRLVEMKQRGEKISMLTSYDYTMAQIVDGAGMDVILVGDSASNVMAGNVTTLPITLDQMIYHAKSVVRGVKRAMVVVDMPFGSYQGNEISLNDIGKEFGDRDHTTVLHSLDKVEKQMRTDPAFAEVVKEITTNINAKR